MKPLIIVSILSLILIGCGVKGDPQPPKTPAYLGKGHPTYKEATQELEMDNTQFYEALDQEKKNKKKEGK